MATLCQLSALFENAIARGRLAAAMRVTLTALRAERLLPDATAEMEKVFIQRRAVGRRWSEAFGYWLDLTAEFALSDPAVRQLSESIGQLDETLPPETRTAVDTALLGAAQAAVTEFRTWVSLN